MFNPFQEDTTADTSRVLVASTIFHAVIAVLVVIGLLLKPEPEIKEIPVFDMVQLPKPPAPPPPPPPQAPEPEVEPDKPPRPVKEKKKKEKKVEKKKKKKKKKKIVKRDSVPNIDLPPRPTSPLASASKPSLQTVGSVFVDPLLQEYLDRLVVVLMSNFKPPKGVNTLKGASTRVGFTIQRGGRITGIGLKQSSGNGTWDRLGVRAVKISRLAPLPFNYRAPALQLYFDFKEE